MKIPIVCTLLLILSSCHTLEHCINHILHESGNEDFHCDNEEDLHFYSTYVLPNGAYRCLEEMKGRKGFYVSTVKELKGISVSQEEIKLGELVRENIRFNGWRCNSDGLVKSVDFKGLKLFLSKCKHNQADFEDICIIKGWPLIEVSDETL